MRTHMMVGSLAARKYRNGSAAMELKDRSDSDIIDAVRDGNKEAYKEIVERYKKRAYYTAIGLVSNPQDAFDLSQVAFIKAYRNLRRFDTAGLFFPWFHRILRNVCLDHLRHLSRVREVPLEEAHSLDSATTDTDVKGALWRAIENLPPDEREIIVLHYFEGLRYREIAEALGKPVGTVMSSLYYARQRLRERLKGIG
jgi:RNA polymerase sigma factor (sigma-70 family)